jgi:hypothetical protein
MFFHNKIGRNVKIRDKPARQTFLVVIGTCHDSAAELVAAKNGENVPNPSQDR